MLSSDNLIFKAKWFLGLVLAGLIVVVLSFESHSNNPDAIVKVKLPQKLTEDSKKGRTIFENNCSACHGKWGGGSANGPPLIHGIYEPNHHNDESFRRAVKNGVRGHHWTFGNMPPVPKVTSEDVEFIILYIRAVQKENGIF